MNKLQENIGISELFNDSDFSFNIDANESYNSLMDEDVLAETRFRVV